MSIPPSHLPGAISVRDSSRDIPDGQPSKLLSHLPKPDDRRTKTSSPSPKASGVVDSTTRSPSRQKEDLTLQVHDSWFLVLITWFLVFGSWFLVLGFWFLVFGCIAPNSEKLIRDEVCIMGFEALHGEVISVYSVYSNTMCPLMMTRAG